MDILVRRLSFIKKKLRIYDLVDDGLDEEVDLMFLEHRFSHLRVHISNVF